MPLDAASDGLTLLVLDTGCTTRSPTVPTADRRDGVREGRRGAGCRCLAGRAVDRPDGPAGSATTSCAGEPGTWCTENARVVDGGRRAARA